MAIYSDLIKSSCVVSENRRYDFTFNILSKDALSVFVSNDVAAGDIQLRYIADYEIELNNDEDGGHIMLTDDGVKKCKIGGKITILHTPDFTQEIRFKENDSFYIKTIEDMADKLTYLTLSIKESLNRTVMLPHSLDKHKAYEELFLLIDEYKKFAELCSKYNDDSEERRGGFIEDI